MIKTTLAALAVTAASMQPAKANDLADLLTGIIVGAVIVDSIKNHDKHSNHRPTRSSPYYEQPNPNVTCYKQVTEQGAWLITRKFNCYDQVIGVVKHRRQQHNW